MGVAGSSRFQGKTTSWNGIKSKRRNCGSSRQSLGESHRWLTGVVVLTLLVEDGNTSPADGGADADPSPLTSACLAREPSSDAS